MDGTRERVVVGYDGSKHAEGALQWAAAEAARRHVRLDVTSVIDDGGLGIDYPAGTAHWWIEMAADSGRRMATEAVSAIRRTWPELDVDPVGLAGRPAAVLIDVSRTADLIVVGTRGHNPLADMVLGSVAERLAAHGHCPVVVVHGDAAVHPGPDHPVVVGVDDSDHTRRAVDLAAAWAHDARAPLTVICAWTGADTWEYLSLTATQRRELEASARTTAQEAVDKAVAQALHLHPDLRVTGSVVPGTPSKVLTVLSEDAGLLVVGSRGRGAFASLMLGSVSHALVRTAPCAVAVVGEHARSTGDEHGDPARTEESGSEGAADAPVT
jgi:nucleotide-binding universal stress UspA family protein